MANRRNEQILENEPEVQEQELNLDKKVTVKNISDWDVGFKREVENGGDVSIAPFGTARLSRLEIIAQSQNNNALFNGLGDGEHATLYIDDAPTRVELGFESANGKKKQVIFSDDVVKKLFKIDNQEEFEKAYYNAIRTRAERRAIVAAISRLKLNDYSKIRFIERATGFNVK